MKTSKVRVRFAPSPTGPLHIGGIRTALYNYLFAKKNDGKFILRIEDTDTTRFVAGAEEYVYEALKWLGIQADEGPNEGGAFGPYRQSERKNLYFRYVQQLINSGWAYYAFDTSEELDILRKKHEAEKKAFAYDMHIRESLNNSLTMNKEELKKKLESGQPWVVRFKMPENLNVEANDLIRGKITFNTNTLDDKVLYKSSDRMPTYHLANITDDKLMEITHVIRGEEWLPSLPLHIMLYKAFGWENFMPLFAHLPLILKPEGKGKLSKRDGDKAGFPVFPIEYKSPEGELASGYRESGYFPEAVNNMLALLGWNPGTEQEIMNMNELIDLFSLERVNKSGARFDPEKARWFNHQYLIKKSDAELSQLFIPYLQTKNIVVDKSKLETIVGLIKERVSFVHELWDQSAFFFVPPTTYDKKVVKSRWKGQIPEFIAELVALFSSSDIWEAANLKEKVSALIKKRELGFGNVMNALRLTLTGGAFGPDLFVIVELLGKEETIKRINKALKKLDTN